MRLLALVAGLALAGAATAATPPEPDYAKAENWAANAAGPGAAAARPQGASAVAAHPDVDAFFIHPTTYITDAEMNQDVSDAKVNAWTDASSIARQASAFSGCCRIFAPRYRQASVKALRGTPEEREAAYALAYTDIERAFDWYLKHANKGRPFILAGHSQGGLHVATLLEKRIDGKPLQKKLVAAYTLGMNIPEGAFGTVYKTVKPCQFRQDIGCVLQWNAVLEGSDIDAIVGFSDKAILAKYGPLENRRGFCINPVSFEAARPATPAGEALGAVIGDPGAGSLLPLKAGAVAARCEKGFLLVTPDPALLMKPLPGGSMHFHDFGLFWADIRADAIRRSHGYFRH